MIPKLYAKESGYPPTFNSVGNALNGMGGPIPANFLPSNVYIPETVVIQAGGEMDSLLQNHRRKMLRRAANRRSAQLSRARKKAYMEDLKIENARLQKMVDILDSQPDLVFCTNIDGQITYISDRAKSLIKIDESLDVDPSHMSQILASESLDVFLDALNQVKQSSVYSTRNSQTCAPISAVREVCFHDSNGYPTIGYIRCSKVFRRPNFEDLQESGDVSETNPQTGLTNIGPACKKIRKNVEVVDGIASMSAGVPNNITGMPPESDAALAGALALQSLQKSMAISSGKTSGGTSFNSGLSDANTSEDSNKMDQQLQVAEDQEEEFVCVLRPADASIPQGSSVVFQTYLSTASMVEHDRQRDDCVTVHVDGTCGGSPSCSLSNDSGSEDKFCSTTGSGLGSGSGQSSNDKIGTGTSSETGSDENDSA